MLGMKIKLMSPTDPCTDTNPFNSLNEFCLTEEEQSRAVVCLSFRRYREQRFCTNIPVYLYLNVRADKGKNFLISASVQVS